MSLCHLFLSKSWILKIPFIYVITRKMLEVCQQKHKSSWEFISFNHAALPSLFLIFCLWRKKRLLHECVSVSQANDFWHWKINKRKIFLLGQGGRGDVCFYADVLYYFRIHLTENLLGCRHSYNKLGIQT